MTNTSQTKASDLDAIAETGPVIAEGVDQEPVENNRRLFTGPRMIAVAILATLYAGFHMAALNGISISAWTGIDLPLLPQFPLETWNFRIVHIAGALVLGFVLYAPYTWKEDAEAPKDTALLSKAGYALFIPAALALWSALSFGRLIDSGTLPEMGGLVSWAAFPGTEIYETEIWNFGVPLLVATFGAILLGWF